MSSSSSSQQDTVLNPEYIAEHNINGRLIFESSNSLREMMAIYERLANNGNAEAVRSYLTDVFGTTQFSASKISASQLPRMKPTDADKETQCPVCLELLTNPSPSTDQQKNVEQSEPKIENIVRLPCDHKYHEECIMMWLNNTNTCPTCRHKLKSDFEIEEERRKADLEELHDSMFS
ncbi:unnamed protein product [Caenorhabditis bovis]|uniref:RING-type domain-containing protein n=1 Tax=Caenorhabditis bovis TaxID=2654633 RepID=A0A8S1ETY3_9PELO|nr:unnamed protein product [Caenorhabditis bovis]